MAKPGKSYLLERLRTNYPDFPKYIEELESREKIVIEERLKGKLLREIGAELPRSVRVGGGISVDRNRVFQLQNKACRKLIRRCFHAC